ncbi:hypothetical protein [Streptomyces sp. NPDC058412]|uniref:hypothetical protein n=1 Tax=Streptomyces sp. NPDC058412 TaxID=3346486 RepID=UPI00364AFD96
MTRTRRLALLTVTTALAAGTLTFTTNAIAAPTTHTITTAPTAIPCGGGGIFQEPTNIAPSCWRQHMYKHSMSNTDISQSQWQTGPRL